MAPHHELMMTEIQRRTGQGDGRLYIGMPPRHGKSELASVRLGAWYLGNNPDKQVIHCSYAAELSNAFSRQVRMLVRDDSRFRSVFPAFGLDPERQRIDDWKTNRGGGFKSLGVGGGVTGHGADLLIIDDPHKEGDAESLVTLDRIYTWYSTAARTRLSPGASIIFLMTRWHPLDLAGRLLSLTDGDTWDQIVLPALAEKDDILGRSEGEALWPERYSREALLRIKNLDDRYFQALFQNNPLGADDVMFRKSDVLWSDGYGTYGEQFYTVDLASSVKETADYTVLAFWNWRDDDLTLCWSYRARESWRKCGCACLI